MRCALVVVVLVEERPQEIFRVFVATVTVSESVPPLAVVCEILSNIPRIETLALCPNVLVKLNSWMVVQHGVYFWRSKHRCHVGYQATGGADSSFDMSNQAPLASPDHERPLGW